MDNFIKLTVAAGGAVSAYLFGGWSATMNALLFFILADYLTGILASGTQGTLSSKVGMIGIARKIFIVFMVAVGHFVDTLLGDKNIIMSAVIFFYIANELLSILENAGRMGMPIPPILKNAIKALSDKGGGSNG